MVHHYLARLDPDGTEPDPTEGRSLSLAKHSDGSVSGRFELDAVGGEKVQAVLESMVQADRPAGDLRTRGQQLGDALAQWADNTLAAGGLPILRTVKPHVVALIPLADLADPYTGHGAARPASARGSPPPAPACWPATAGSPGSSSDPNRSRWRWAAPTGSFHPICGGPPRSATGTACSPAATPPATGATSITVLHWIDGGETSLENSALLCERHSHLVSTTVSGSNGNPTAAGAPGGPTAPRSFCTPTCSRPECARAGPWGAHGSPPSSQGRTVSSGHCCTQRSALAS